MSNINEKKAAKAAYDKARNIARKTARLFAPKMGRIPVHGMTGSPIYKLWRGMILRCHNPNVKHFQGYGFRGIVVCERWRNSFVNFFFDMGHRPGGMMLDRINNDGPYSPDNCRWATPKQSANNRRDNRRVTMNGKTLTLTEWCRKLDVPYERVKNRVYVLRWSPHEALFTHLHAKIKYERLKH